MLAEWTAECSPDAPTIAVPWHDPAGSMQFIDLRANPYDIVEIPEAERYPALNRSLRALNAQRSPFLTSKCDVWTSTAEDPDHDELSSLRLELDLEAEEATHGVASYLDLLWRDRALFGSAHQQQEMLDRLTRRAERIPHREAALSCVLRPAMYDLAAASGGAATSMTLEGYAVTLYVRAVAADAASAIARWSAALEDVTALLRSKDLAPARTSATIDAASSGAPSA